MERKTTTIWPIALGLALLSMALAFVTAFSYVGLAFFLTGLVFMATSAGAFLSRWMPRAWQAYAAAFLVLAGLLLVAYYTG